MMMPVPVLAECREKARAQTGRSKPANYVAAAGVLFIWILVSVLLVIFLKRLFNAA